MSAVPIKKIIDNTKRAYNAWLKNAMKRQWFRVAYDTFKAMNERNLPLLGSSIAFAGTLAFFPMVVASVAIASMAVRPDQLDSITERMAAFLPKDIESLLTTQITNAMADNSASFWVAFVAIALAVFGVSNAVNNVVTAINITYGVKETRNIVTVRLLSIGMTMMMIVGILLLIPLITFGRPIFETLGMSEPLISIAMVLRWPLMAVIVMIGLTIFYRYAPNRPRQSWRWFSWGAVIATILWVATTALFFVYLQYFAGLSDSYSLFAGVIALMLWLNVAGLIILLGAEINRQLEKRK